MIKIFKGRISKVEQLEEDINKFLDERNKHLDEYELTVISSEQDDLVIMVNY